jgi:hypothetical protein
MMRSRPPRASATPATILLAALAFNAGDWGGDEPDTGEPEKQEPDFGDDHPIMRSGTIG